MEVKTSNVPGQSAVQEVAAACDASLHLKSPSQQIPISDAHRLSLDPQAAQDIARKTRPAS